MTVSDFQAQHAEVEHRDAAVAQRRDRLASHRRVADHRMLVFAGGGWVEPQPDMREARAARRVHELRGREFEQRKVIEREDGHGVALRWTW